MKKFLRSLLARKAMQPLPSSSSPSISSIGGSPPPPSSNNQHQNLLTRGGRTHGHGSLRLKQNDVTIAGAGETPSSFSLMITGQIVCAQTSPSSPLPLMNNQKMYCRYSFSYGDDWNVTSGVSEGISQIANSRRALKNTDEEKGSLLVWNFPIEISFQSTNTYGWPRLCLSVFSGRDVLQGYASVLLPINPGVHTKYAKMYRPVNGKSSWQQLIAKLTGTKNPEFDDSKITARGEGRALTRVIRSENNLTLKISLMTTRKDFLSFGYKSSS